MLRMSLWAVVGVIGIFVFPGPWIATAFGSLTGIGEDPQPSDRREPPDDGGLIIQDDAFVPSTLH